MAGILPAGLSGYVAAEQNARQGGEANLRQALGILGMQNQMRQQAQDEQVNPLRIGILQNQLEKGRADLALQQDATAGLSGGGAMDTDKLRQVGLRLGLAGHPGAAGVLNLAEKLDEHKLQRGAMNNVRSMMTPLPVAPAGTELAGPPDASGDPTSKGMSAVPGVSSVLAPGASPSPAELQKMIELDKSGIPIRMTQATPENMAVNIAQAKIPGAIAGPLMPPSQFQQQSLEIQRQRLAGQGAGSAVPKGYRETPEGNLTYIPGGPADPASKSPGMAGGGVISPETASFVARQYLAGDEKATQGFARSASAKIQLSEAIREEAEKKGMSPEAVAAKVAEFQGIKAGFRTAGTRGANIEMAASEASEMLDIVRETSAKFGRTNFIPFNKALQAYETNTGSPEIKEFGASLNALVNVYARAINPSGTPTINDKEHAREIISTVNSPAQVDGVLKIMQQEMNAARRSPVAVRKSLSGAVTGAPSDVPDRPDSIGNQIRALGVPYEPEKYEYRVVNGKVQRREK